MNKEISDEIKKEIDFRMKKLQTGNVELFSWEEVKNRIKISRSKLK